MARSTDRLDLTIAVDWDIRERSCSVVECLTRDQRAAR